MLVDKNNLAKLAKLLDDRSKSRANSIKTDLDDVRDMFGGKSFKYITQAEYDSLSEEEKADTSIVWNIVDAEDIEIDLYQTKEDSLLFTEDKTIVGAINFIYNNICNIDYNALAFDTNEIVIEGQ